MIVLDCGKNTATIYNSETDTCKTISHLDVLKLPEELESGTTVIGEYAHLGCPRQKYSLSQPFTENLLIDLYDRFKSKNISFKLFPQKSTPRATSFSGLVKSDLNDPKAIYLLLKSFPNITLMNPPTSFEVEDIVQEGWVWKDTTNKILNVARRYSYESDDDKNSVFIKENIQHIYDSLSPVARDVFGFQLYKTTSKHGKKGTINLKEINMCQIYSILAILRDFEGQLRLFKDTNDFPTNYFIKRYVLCMTPFHWRGGVARSNLYYHGMMSWIARKAEKDHQLDFRRKVSIADEDGIKSKKVIRRGHFTPQEDAVFIAYRKQYCKSIFELVNFFKQHLIS
jgi:hypothetical protein